MKHEHTWHDKARAPSRWTLLAAMTGSLLLSGCATTQAVKHADQTAQAAWVKSRQAQQQTTQLSAVVQTHSAQTDRRLDALTTKQTQLTQQFAALSQRLATEQGQLSQVRTQTRPLSPATATDTAHRDKQTSTAAQGFMQKLIARAHRAARQPYTPPAPVPAALTALSYSNYSKIRFKGRIPGWPTAAQLQPSFYPAGYLFRHAVHIYLLNHAQVSPLQFPAADFSFDAATKKQLPTHIPLAGFSLYYPFHTGGGVNEFLSFQGASYFRTLGAGQVWGLSARGVAVNTAIPHRAEEFPYFRAFWIQPPAPGANTLTLYAQLDSPSMTGAYRFIVHPGTQTTVDVNMVLFIRKAVKRLGIAPLTSMFLQGRGSGPRYAPLLRAAHDSDGLSVESATGHWLWRPLRNPKHLVVQQLPFTGIRGFGLMQRARHYRDYQAYGLNYQKRPSAWITPTGGNWGKGHIVLVELPTHSQTNDNITAFWMPDARTKAGQSMTFNYRIAWQGDKQTLPPLGHVISTRHRHTAKADTYVINFRGDDLDKLPAWITLKPVIHIDGPASRLHAWVAKNPATGNWRLELSVKRTDTGPVNLSAKLAYKTRALTETWSVGLPAR